MARGANRLYAIVIRLRSDFRQVASEKALKSIEAAYEQRNDVLSNTYVEMAQEPIAIARQSGDPSRKADVQIDLDLDSCAQVMHTWLVFLANRRLDEIDKRPETKERKEDKKLMEENFRYAINRLREDLK